MGGCCGWVRKVGGGVVVVSGKERGKWGCGRREMRREKEVASPSPAEFGDEGSFRFHWSE